MINKRYTLCVSAAAAAVAGQNSKDILVACVNK